MSLPSLNLSYYMIFHFYIPPALFQIIAHLIFLYYSLLRSPRKFFKTHPLSDKHVSFISWQYFSSIRFISVTSSFTRHFGRSVARDFGSLARNFSSSARGHFSSSNFRFEIETHAVQRDRRVPVHKFDRRPVREATSTPSRDEAAQDA